MTIPGRAGPQLTEAEAVTGYTALSPLRSVGLQRGLAAGRQKNSETSLPTAPAPNQTGTPTLPSRRQTEPPTGPPEHSTPPSVRQLCSPGCATRALSTTRAEGIASPRCRGGLRTSQVRGADHHESSLGSGNAQTALRDLQTQPRCPWTGRNYNSRESPR